MLAFLDQAQSGTPTVPLCLEGWEPRPGYAVCHRETAKGHLVGIGDPLTFDLPGRLAELEDGWRVGLVGRSFNPAALLRAQSWFDTQPVSDLSGRVWHAPVILTREGARAFRVKYGADWLPDLTPEQARLEEIAEAARDKLLQVVAGGDAELELRVACQWAAEFLSATHHTTPRVLGVLGLMDDALAIGCLKVATSISFSVVRE